MTKNLEIDLLRVFVAIVEEGSFTGAGRRLYRTQSTVSLQLKRLEGRLGERLVQRTQGRVTGLTEAGETLLGHAGRLIHANDEATAALGASRLTGTVRLGVPDESAHREIARALVTFRARHPRVHLEVICRLSGELEELIDRGRLDLAIVNRRLSDGAGADRLYAERLAWVAGRSLSWPAGTPLPLIGFPPGCAYRAATVAALEGAGIEWMDVFTSTSCGGVWAAVSAGLGVAALPTNAVPGHSGERVRHPELPWPGEVESRLVSGSTGDTGIVEGLCDHVRAQFAGRPPRIALPAS